MNTEGKVTTNLTFSPEQQLALKELIREVVIGNPPYSTKEQENSKQKASSVPDWLQGIFAVVVAGITITGALISLYVEVKTTQEKVNTTNTRLDSLEKRVDRIEDKIDKLGDKLDNLVNEQRK